MKKGILSCLIVRCLTSVATFFPVSLHFSEASHNDTNTYHIYTFVFYVYLCKSVHSHKWHKRRYTHTHTRTHSITNTNTNENQLTATLIPCNNIVFHCGENNRGPMLFTHKLCKFLLLLVLFWFGILYVPYHIVGDVCASAFAWHPISNASNIIANHFPKVPKLQTVTRNKLIFFLFFDLLWNFGRVQSIYSRNINRIYEQCIYALDVCLCMLQN